MQFTNHTPFPALACEGVDTSGQAFHVVILRQTFTWDARGELIFADSQSPLCEADEFFDDALPGSLRGETRQESDLCPYKPRCDVIVNATAHAPPQTPGWDAKRARSVPAAPCTEFDVGLVVKSPSPPARLPPEPLGLNPFMRASPEALAQWRIACEQARRNQESGQYLIHKSLHITGERQFIKHTGPAQWAALSSLGRKQSSAWKLGEPAPIQTLPLRLHHAFGGEYRLETGRLESDPNSQVILHEAHPANPNGCGFASDKYLAHSRAERLRAPQIEHPSNPIALQHFEHTRSADDDAALNATAPLVAGFGVRPKGHPERATLSGTLDDTFIQSDAALPDDFDFAVWNAAWPDQQTEHLRGDEIIELTNLCAPDAPGAQRNERGDTLLRLALPGHIPFVLARFENGSMGELPSKLDTVLIEPDKKQLVCVWRATVGKAADVRALEARMLQAHDIAVAKAAATIILRPGTMVKHYG